MRDGAGISLGVGLEREGRVCGYVGRGLGCVYNVKTFEGREPVPSPVWPFEHGSHVSVLRVRARLAGSLCWCIIGV